jgi:hypothetical protein
LLFPPAFAAQKGLLLHRRRGGKGLGYNISQERLGERVLRTSSAKDKMIAALMETSPKTALDMCPRRPFSLCGHEI